MDEDGSKTRAVVKMRSISHMSCKRIQKKNENAQHVEINTWLKLNFLAFIALVL
jgi:hypothetical protein